jgi:hypothetical protein
MALQKKKFVTPEIKQSGFFLQYLSCRGVCVMPVLAQREVLAGWVALSVSPVFLNQVFLNGCDSKYIGFGRVSR